MKMPKVVWLCESDTLECGESTCFIGKKIICDILRNGICEEDNKPCTARKYILEEREKRK